MIELTDLYVLRAYASFEGLGRGNAGFELRAVDGNACVDKDTAWVEITRYL